MPQRRGISFSIPLMYSPYGNDFKDFQISFVMARPLQNYGFQIDFFSDGCNHQAAI
jgi:hypothetical protein